MKIGGVYIRSVSKRFWIFLALLGLVLFALVKIACSGGSIPETRSNYANPTLQALEAESGSDWVADKINRAKAIKEMPDNAYPGQYFYEQMEEESVSSFTPYRLNVFIPPDAYDAANLDPLARYKESAEDWVFLPVIPVDNSSRSLLAEDSLTADNVIDEANPVDGRAFSRGVLMAFPRGAVPEEGRSYEVTAIPNTTAGKLFGSKVVFSEESFETWFLYTPVLFADSQWRSIVIKEITEPAAYRAQINMPIITGNYKVSLRYFDWPSGGGFPRLCASVSNSALAGVNSPEVFDGLSDSVINLANGKQVGTNDSYDDDSLDSLLGGVSYLEKTAPPITGYIYFGDPSEEEGSSAIGSKPGDVTFIMPSPRGTLLDDSGPKVTVKITADQWQQVDTSSSDYRRVQPFASCS